MLKERIREENELTELCNLYLEHCYYEKGLSENSVQAYRYDLTGLIRYAESRTQSDGSKAADVKKHESRADIHMLDRDFWHEYMTELTASKKVKTVKRKLACFTGFFYFLENCGIIEQNPLAKFKLKLKSANSVPETLTLKEVRRILNAVYRPVGDTVTGMSIETAEFLRSRDIAILEFLFATGLRVNELCAMSFATYDETEQSVLVLGKGGKERKLYLGNDGVINALNGYIKLRKNINTKSDAIFLNRWDNPLSCQAVRSLVGKYCRQAGMKRNITPHAFRHTFASLLLEEGVELRYIQEFLGHSSITTTQIYLHTSEKRKREILTKMHPRKKLEKIIK